MRTNGTVALQYGGVSMYRYFEIAERIEHDIKEKSLKAGTKAPSVRKLCDTYNCHQTTAIKALNLLKEKGILYSIPQSGFYVIDKEDNHVVSRKIVDFKSSSPDPELFPYKDYQKCINIAIEKNRSELFEYSNKEGYIPLRKAIAKLVTNDYIFVDYKNVVITTGIQQGLSLISEMELPNDGNKILIEQPTYHSYVEYLKNNSIDVITINRTHDGLDFKALETAFSSGTVKLFYTMPRIHNPLGTGLRKAEKEKLIELAYKYDVFIVEDDYMGDYIIDKTNDPLITYDTKQTHVIYLRSFSKIISPGLRVGFAILPDSIRDEFSKNKYLRDLGTSLLEQASLEIYLKNKMYEKHVNRMRMLYAKRADILSKALGDIYLKDNNSSPLGTGNVHLCIELNQKYSIEALERVNIKVANIHVYYYKKELENKYYLPINVSNVEEEQITAGILKLMLTVGNLYSPFRRG
jgi:DNA-binding transcriptional MocR family regulator